MKHQLKHTGALVLVVVAAGLSIGLVAWQNREQQPTPPPAPEIPAVPQEPIPAWKDTVPYKDRERRVRDLDEALEELNRVDISEELARAKEQVAAAMEQIDMQKIQMEIEKAMKQVDVDKIKAEVEESMAKIDWDKIKAEIAQVQQVEMPKLREEMAKVKEEMQKLGPQIEKEMAKAKVEIEKAREELTDYKTFVDGLNADGLIDKHGEYELKHKDGTLLINGKKASDATYNKYRSFLKKYPTFTIEKSDDDFNIRKK